jgi:hypothetical protein
MGRPPLEKKQRQLTVALPPEVRSRLEAVATASGHSIAEEIRRRIDQTIAWEAVDPVTRELLRGIKNLSNQMRTDFGVDWHANPKTHEAFVSAVYERVMAYEPPAPKPGAAAFDLGLVEVKPGDSTHLIGRMRERDDRRLGDYKYLQEVQHRRGRWTSRSVKAKKEPHHG